MERTLILPNNPELTGLVDLRPEIEYACPNGEKLTFQLLKPMWKSEGGKGFPTVVFIQGSAWTKPNMFWEIPQLSLLARQGFVIASVTHRSCMTDKAPAFLQDVKSAVRFLRAHAAEYDIDPERLGAWGTSSGGNTALLLGMTGDDPRFKNDLCPDQSDAVKAVAECFGPTDIYNMMTVQYADSPEADDPDNILMKLVGLPDENRALCSMISPIDYVQPGRAFPPFLILHGDADPVVLFSDSEKLHKALLENGYESDFVHVTNAPHEGNFWSLALLEEIFTFFKKNL